MLADLAKRSSKLLIVNIAGTGLAFLIHLLLARTLGPSSYGIYVYALTWASSLALLSQLGTESMVVRQVSAYRTREEWSLLRGLTRFSRSLVSATGLVLAGVVAALTLVLGSRLSPELRHTLYFASLLIPVLGLLQLHLSLLNGLHHSLAGGAIGNIVRPILLLGLLFAWMGLGIALDAVSVMAFNAMAAALVMVLAAGWFQSKVRNEVAGIVPNYNRRQWLSSSLIMLFMSFAHILLSQTDILMIGAMIGTDAAAIYSPAAKIASLVLFPMIAINTVVAPMIAEAYAVGRHTELKRILSLTIFASAGVAVPIAIGVCFFSRELLALFGPVFTGGRSVLIILAIGQMLNVLAGPVDYLLIMTRFERVAAIVLGTCASLNVVLNALLIPRFGIEGAAVATVISIVGWNLGMAGGVWYKLRVGHFPNGVPEPVVGVPQVAAAEQRRSVQENGPVA